MQRFHRRCLAVLLGAALLGAALLGTVLAPPATSAVSPTASIPAERSGTKVTAMAAGLAHTCALLTNGRVKCWGFNGAGQLGLGDVANRADGMYELGDFLPTVDLGTGRKVKAIAGGDFHTCALLDNSTVKCWGLNDAGQLGYGDTSIRGDAPSEMGNNLPTVNLGTGRKAKSIVAGGTHTCAILDNSTVKCWGLNDRGQLGYGDTSIRGDAPGEMGNSLPTVSLGTGRKAKSISLGKFHSCAVLDNNTAKCWGQNSVGQLGYGDANNRGDGVGEMGNSLLAVSLGTGRKAKSVVAGGTHTCAILDNGTVKCWGLNIAGQLGYGDTNDRGDGANEMGNNLPTVDLGAGRKATSIDAGALHTCVRLDIRTLKCWGNNGYGQLGYGDTTSRGDNETLSLLGPVDLGTGRKATSVAAGDYHTCVLLDNGTIKCWGFNSVGQLGNGDTTNRGHIPGTMGDGLPAVNLGVRIRAISTGSSAAHSCAILEDSSVQCWGWNIAGQLGYGNTTNRGDGLGEMGNNLPTVNLGTGRTAKAVATGATHTCAILDNGTVKCWGSGFSGQLGYGDTLTRGDAGGEMGDSLPTVNLGTGRTAKAIALGTTRTCAILDNGGVKCWGLGNYGQLGYGDSTNRGDGVGEMGDSLPTVNLGTGRKAKAIAGGDSHTCAILDNGSVKCWGYGISGQLGYGSFANLGDNPGEMGSFLPAVNLGTGRKAKAIVAGGTHTCAILDNGSVKCWGSGLSGVLGYGDQLTRGTNPDDMGNNLPTVDLGTGRKARSLASGQNHVCAILDNFTMKCWGESQYGQLGYGNNLTLGEGADEMGDYLPAVAVAGSRRVSAITAGLSTCALLDDGSLRCWGNNDYGQLGAGDTRDRGDDADEMGINLRPVPMTG